MVDSPKFVCICGSTRFKQEILDANRDLTLEGKIVLAPGVFGHTDMPDYDWSTDATDLKTKLDRLHFRKIELSQEVFVVNPGGYIGESTQREIEYAERCKIPIRYLVDPEPTPCVFCERVENRDYEDHNGPVVRFEPLNPVVPGHMLFLPREHLEHPDGDGVRMAMWYAQKYAAEQGEDFNLITSSGASATQTIKHIHVHYVPRTEGDGLPLPWDGKKLLKKARGVVTQYLSTAEKWRYDRVKWAFDVMLGEISEDTPEPKSPADLVPGDSVRIGQRWYKILEVKQDIIRIEVPGDSKKGTWWNKWQVVEVK